MILEEIDERRRERMTAVGLVVPCMASDTCQSQYLAKLWNQAEKDLHTALLIAKSFQNTTTTTNAP